MLDHHARGEATPRTAHPTVSIPDRAHHAEAATPPDTVSSYAEQGLSPLRDLLTSDRVNEVAINPDGRVFVEHADAAHMTEAICIDMDERAIRSLGDHLAGETGNALGEDHPIVGGRVHVFGADVRVQIVVPSVVERGVSLSIRKYVRNVLDPGAIAFLGNGPRDVDAERLACRREIADAIARRDLAHALRRAIDGRLNVLISGGTSSGKTTIARALLAMAHPDERLVTIEDAIELRPVHRNAVALVADRREGSDRSAAKLLQSALRMRPDRLVLGEIRGPEAYDFLEAINTGHPGSITTVHADTPRLAFERLALMVMQTGVRLSRADVVDYARSTIDMVVQVGRREGRRGVLAIEVPDRS